MKKFVFILIAGLLAGCSTQKNTLMSRSYHNLTAKFNYLFNAQESYNESVKKYTKEYPFNYNATLPVFLFSESSAPSKTAEGMDRAIVKSGLLIKFHSITAKPSDSKRNSASKIEFYNRREFCNYVDDAYLLIGKGNAFQHEYSKSRQALDQIIVNYTDPDTKTEAAIWRGMVSGAENDLIQYLDALTTLEKSRNFPKSKQSLLNAAYADYYIKKKDLKKAVEYIQKAAELESNRDDRSRYWFISGQLYQQLNQPVLAQNAFRQAAKAALSYEMTFNAKLAEIRSENSGNSGNLQNILLKMAKSEKNGPYRDQIYFTIGQIFLQENNEKSAMEYFNKSLEYSSPNSNQKGVTYYTLAEYAYTKKDFLKAQSLYDSASNSLNSSHPLYNDAQVRSQKLNRLSHNMREYQRLDSLIKLSLLDSKDLNHLIDEKIAKLTAQQAKAQEEQSKQQLYLMNQNSISLNRNQSSSWYFYNQSTLAFGATEFKMRWGQRKLEDNWRRKNKGLTPEADAAQSSAAAAEKEKPNTLSPLSREYYLNGLPKNSTERQALEEKKIDALLNAAEAYQADVEDSKEAVNAAQLALSQPVNQEQELKAYSVCYQAYVALNDAVNTEHYKNLIVEKFPKSGLAKSFTNSSHGSSSNTASNSELEKCIHLLHNGNYQECYDIASKFTDAAESGAAAPQFSLIKAMARGGLSGRDEYRKALSEVVTTHPGTDAAKTAASYIELLDKNVLQNIQTSPQNRGTEATPQQAKDAPKSSFVTPEGEHLIILIVPRGTNFNQLKFNLVSFNVEQYPSNEFSIETQSFDSNNEVVAIKPFGDKKAAMDYYYKLLEKQDLLNQSGAKNFAIFPISVKNFEILNREKAVTSYADFFMEQYMK